AERNLSKRFRKMDDPNYSLFEEEYKRYVFMKKTSLIFLLVGLPLFVLGLVLIITVSILGIIPLTFGGLGIMMIMYLPILLMDRKKFKRVLEAKESKQPENLVNLARRYSISSGYLDQEVARIATYLLVDQKSRDIAFILKERLSMRKPMKVYEILRTFYLLAIKLGYKDHYELYNNLEQGSSKDQKELSDEVDNEIVIPITKIYYLEGIPERAKCMVSGLELEFLMDEIVVCPFCSAWAKKDLLFSWLSENDFCPVCRRELHMKDCPLVQIGQEKSNLK
ncbi:MAG: hypothetical protein ACTSSH_10595, partial [Candidatus Heimdallarchaeota archaeon]